MEEDSTPTAPAASFFVDIGKAEFSTEEHDFLKKNSRSSSKLKKELFLNSAKEHRVLLPVSGLAGLTQFFIPLRM